MRFLNYNVKLAVFIPDDGQIVWTDKSSDDLFIWCKKLDGEVILFWLSWIHMMTDRLKILNAKDLDPLLAAFGLAT